jgi:RNA polymerase sigma-70 factor (ECF subfamily)
MIRPVPNPKRRRKTGTSIRRRPLAAALPKAAPVSPFAQQVAEQYDRLYRRALVLTRSEDRAADLVQDTIARALRFESKFSPGTNLHAWLQTMLGNLYLSEFRRAKFTGAAPAPPPGSGEPDDFFEKIPAPLEATPEAAALRGEIRRSLNQALVELPEAYRWPLRMFLEEGLSYEQIAEGLDIPIGTVMSRIFRARRILKEDLSQRLPGVVPVMASPTGSAASVA